jgi:hypothetical protein
MVRLILLLFMQCRLLLILSAVVCSKTRNPGMQLFHPAAPAVGYFYGYADFSIQELLDDDSYIAKNKSAISTVSFPDHSVARSANRRLDFVKERLIFDKSPNNLRGVAAVPRNAEGRTEQEKICIQTHDVHYLFSSHMQDQLVCSFLESAFFPRGLLRVAAAASDEREDPLGQAEVRGF